MSNNHTEQAAPQPIPILEALPHSPEYWERLVKCSYQKQAEPIFSEFGRLQRLNLTYLFNQIARIKASIRGNNTTSKEEMDQLGLLLHQYTEAIRDYQYLSQLQRLPAGVALEQRMHLESSFPDIALPRLGEGGKTGNAPYDNVYLSLRAKTTQAKDGVRELLRLHLPKVLSWTEPEKRERRAEYGDGAPPEIYSPFLDKLARFIVGVIGGASLIVPMAVMVFGQSLTKSMITVSVAVLAFALVLGLVFETKNQETLVATATYAAVLVVFVGTSVTNNSSG